MWFEAGASAPVVVVKVSLALDLVRSFFWLETSPHCEMEPWEADGKVSSETSCVEGQGQGRRRRRAAYRQ